MLSSRINISSKYLRFFASTVKKGNQFDLSNQPKLPPIKTVYHDEAVATAWVPKRFRDGIPELVDPTKVLANAPINYPLPIYSLESSEKRDKEYEQDIANVSKEVSPLTQYGVFPASIAAIIALVSNEIFIINEESLIMATFGSFLFTMYVQFGGIVKKEFANRANKLKQLQQEGIELQLGAVDSLLAILKKRATLSDSLKQIDTAHKVLVERIQDMLVHKHTRILHEVIQEKLDAVLTVQNRAMRKAHHNFVKSTFNSLTNFTKGNKTFQDLVVKECISVLESSGKPAEAKFVEFKADWKSYASELAKSKKGKVEKDASTFDLIKESARLASGVKLDANADMNDYILQLVSSVDSNYSYATISADFKAPDSKKKLGALLHSWAKENVSSTNASVKSLANLVVKVCAPPQDTTRRVFDYVSMYQEYLMALRRFNGYELTEEQRSRIYRSVTSTMKNETTQDFKPAPIDVALPAKNKLPEYTAYIAY